MCRCGVCGGLGTARVWVCAGGWALPVCGCVCGAGHCLCVGVCSVLGAGADVLTRALCSGVRDALHLLPVQEPEAGALLSVSAGAGPPCAAASRDALTTDTPESPSAAVQAVTLPLAYQGDCPAAWAPHRAITVPSGDPQAPEAASSAFSYTPKSQGLKDQPHLSAGVGMWGSPSHCCLLWAEVMALGHSLRPVRVGQKWAGAGGAEQQVRRPQVPPHRPLGYWGLLLN